MAQWQVCAIATIVALTTRVGWGIRLESPVQAQVIPDSSLGAEASVIMVQGLQDQVSGGAARGNSLFHSFQDLNVAAGRSLYFTNPAGISHIFSRVTGNNPSAIDGTFGVLGNADLFLLNPNGVLFGPNAQLDVRGSFTATTAASVQVGGLEFSAVSPAVPPLLNLSVQPGLQWGAIANPSQIRNQGVLQVDSGRSLSLIGGQLEQAGTLIAPGGTVTLQGERLSLTGRVDTRDSTGHPGTLRLISPVDLQIQPIGPLTNAAINQALSTNGVVVRSDRDLIVNGTLRSQSPHPLALEASRDLRYSSAGQTSDFIGDIFLTSGRTIQLDQAILFTKRRGDRPNQIQVNTQQLELTNSGLGSGTDSGQDGANITVQVAQMITLQNSSITTSTDSAGNAGNTWIRSGGDIILKAGELGSYGANSSGNAGHLTLEARRLQIDDRQQSSPSKLRTTTDIVSQGNGGNITIRTTEVIDIQGRQLPAFVPQGFTAQRFFELAQITSVITSSAFGTGQSGNIEISTERLNLSDGAAISIAPGLFATTNQSQSGNVNITAQEIQLQRGASIASVTLGATHAGNVWIQGLGNRAAPSRLSLSDGAFISTNSFGLNPLVRSGNAGELAIAVDELTVLNGSFLGAGTDSSGSGGTLRLDAQQITVSGTGADGLFPSALRTDVGSGIIVLPNGRKAIATGTGGQLRLNANSLQVLNGGQILASTTSAGNAGNVEIHADQIRVSGSSLAGIPSSVEAQSTGTGAAGTLRITGRRLTLDQGARISTTTQQGQGGNMVLDLQDVLVLRHGSSISATAGQAGSGGNGGNIEIAAGWIVAPALENSDITANAFEGRGGTINIRTGGLLGIAFRPQLTPKSDITASSSIGLDGVVQVEQFGLEPTQDLQTLPTTFKDASNEIDTSCDRPTASQFILTGRGGLPPDPRDPLTGPAILQDWREPRSSEQGVVSRKGGRSVNPVGKTWMEATGWQVGADGKIRLIAAHGMAGERMVRATANCGLLLGDPL